MGAEFQLEKMEKSEGRWQQWLWLGMDVLCAVELYTSGASQGRKFYVLCTTVIKCLQLKYVFIHQGKMLESEAVSEIFQKKT